MTFAFGNNPGLASKCPTEPCGFCKTSVTNVPQGDGEYTMTTWELCQDIGLCLNTVRMSVDIGACDTSDD